MRRLSILEAESLYPESTVMFDAACSALSETGGARFFERQVQKYAYSEGVSPWAARYDHIYELELVAVVDEIVVERVEHKTRTAKGRKRKSTKIEDRRVQKIARWLPFGDPPIPEVRQPLAAAGLWLRESHSGSATPNRCPRAYPVVGEPLDETEVSIHLTSGVGPPLVVLRPTSDAMDDAVHGVSTLFSGVVQAGGKASNYVALDKAGHAVFGGSSSALGLVNQDVEAGQRVSLAVDALRMFGAPAPSWIDGVLAPLAD